MKLLLPSERVRPWSLQKKQIDGEGVVDQEEILELVEAISDLEVRALVSTMYLTAGRVTEVINIKKKNIRKVEINDRPWLRINLPNEKHRKRKRKTILIPLDNKIERRLVHHILVWTKFIMAPENVVFKMVRRTAYKKTAKFCQRNPHYFRHIRACHLVNCYDFNSFQLMKWMGWTDLRPTVEYLAQNYVSFTKKM